MAAKKAIELTDKQADTFQSHIELTIDELQTVWNDIVYEGDERNTVSVAAVRKLVRRLNKATSYFDKF